MKPEQLAIVRIPAVDQVRPAAFVFVDDAGVTWVEPSYLDPAGSTAPAVRRILGVAREAGDGFDVLTDGMVLATVRPMTDRDQDDADGSCGRALAQFTDQLVASGVSIEDERAAIEANLAAQPEL